MKYIAYKDSKAFMKDLKRVYGAESEEIAFRNLEAMKDSWKKYRAVVENWQMKWENLSTYFSYGAQIRRLIYTTNTLEGFNRQLRKVTKNKAVFPNDEALRKTLYLTTRDITEKWSMPIGIGERLMDSSSSNSATGHPSPERTIDLPERIVQGAVPSHILLLTQNTADAGFVPDCY